MSQGDQVTNPNTNSNPLWQQLANMNTNYPTSIVPQQQMSSFGPSWNSPFSSPGVFNQMNQQQGNSQQGIGSLLSALGGMQGNQQNPGMGFNRNFGQMQGAMRPMNGQLNPGMGGGMQQSLYGQGYGMGSMLGSMFRQPQQNQMGQVQQQQQNSGQQQQQQVPPTAVFNSGQ